MSTQSTDYRAIKAISNSVMGVYEDDFDQFVNYWVKDIPFAEKKDDALTMGSVIDTLLTRPEEFNDKFIIFRGSSPTGQMHKFCHSLASQRSDIDTELAYQRAYDEVGFVRDTLAKVLEKFEAYKPYYQFLIESKNKTVLATDMASRANYIVEQMRNGKYTRHIVNATSMFTGMESLEVFNQLELTNTYTIGIEDTSYDVPVKGALDKVIVDHNRKVIIPVDYKSSFNSEGFISSYYKWRYYRQGSLYTWLINQWKMKNDMVDYEVKPFIFVVCSTTGGKPYLYKMSETDLVMARKGGFLQNGNLVKGWAEILREIAYLSFKGDWDYPYEALINNGIIPLNIFRND